MSLYLKYRPRNFAEIVGQDHIITILENAVEQGQIVHSYLFYGSRGTGKTSAARILAKILLIREIPDENTQKHILQAADQGNLVDLIEIDAASNRGIDEIRDLKENILFSPQVAGAKVYIIDEVHMMTKEAFNALLKTLEEPPAHVYFILATTEIHKVPETIQSRCQRFAFRRIREADIVRHLQNIADREHIAVERDALRAMARHVQGGMRDAIALLDQLSTLPKITEADLRDRIGETGEEFVGEALQAIHSGDRQALLALASRLEEQGVAAEIFLRQLLAKVREELHATVEAGEDLAPFIAALDLLLHALEDVRIAPVPMVVLETTLLTLTLPVSSSSGAEGKVEAMKVEKKERKAKTDEGPTIIATLPVPVDIPPRPSTAEEAKPAVYTAKEISVGNVRELWSDLLGKIRRPAVRVSLQTSTVSGVEQGAILLDFSSSFHCEKVSGTEASREVEEHLAKLFGQPVRIRCRVASERAAAAVVASESPVSLVDAAREVFGET